MIMNAGDELVLRFVAPEPPPAGWQRDFVLIGDGWVKDGDYHTTFSKTVLPLPAHDQPDYTPPGDLEDDPVYRRHAPDWQRYHTRYITPQRFHEVAAAAVRGTYETAHPPCVAVHFLCSPDRHAYGAQAVIRNARCQAVPPPRATP